MTYNQLSFHTFLMWSWKNFSGHHISIHKTQECNLSVDPHQHSHNGLFPIASLESCQIYATFPNIAFTNMQIHVHDNIENRKLIQLPYLATLWVPSSNTPMMYWTGNCAQSVLNFLHILLLCYTLQFGCKHTGIYTFCLNPSIHLLIYWSDVDNSW